MSDFLDKLRAELSEVDSSSDLDTEHQSDQPKSKTVLRLDNWSHRRGEELFDASQELGGTIKDKYSAADFFSLAFEPESVFEDNPEDMARREYMETLMQTLEFRDLHNETMLNELQSEIAAISFANQFCNIDDSPTEQEVKRAAKAALDEAKDTAEEARSIGDAVGGGCGGEPGDSASSMDAKQTIQHMKRAKRNRNVRAIINIAGRYRRFAQSAQNSKVIVGQDDVTGIKLGSDLSKLLQSERMKLTCGIEEIEDLTAMRLLQKRCMIRETSASIKENRGPVVICVDESGSMEGNNVQEAKATALAMYWIAKQQGRWCCLYGYSGGAEGNYLVIRPNEDRSGEIMDWLAHFYDCGTSCDVPIDKLPKQWSDIDPPKGKTDIIFLTDALVNAPQKIVDRFIKWKAEAKAKVQTVVVGGFMASSGQLHDVSDVLVYTRSFGLEQSGEPMEKLFQSI